MLYHVYWAHTNIMKLIFQIVFELCALRDIWRYTLEYQTNLIWPGGYKKIHAQLSLARNLSYSSMLK